MYDVYADSAFERHFKRSIWRRVMDRVNHRCRKLFRLNAVVGESGFQGQHDLGMQVVPVDQIIGTVGRENDFDNVFRPRRQESRKRWMSIYYALNEGKGLPAVELLKVGDDYFVEDGHHRVSVAYALEQTYIDAHVIEIEAQHSRSADVSACALSD